MNIKTLPSVKLTLVKNLHKNLPQKSLKQQETGYSLVELIFVVLIIGILSAIAAPGWNAFINRERLRSSTDKIHNALRKAQSQAKLNKETWQASFRQVDYVDINDNGTEESEEPKNRVQWAVHPVSYPVADLNVASISDGSSLYLWQSLEQGIEINTASTTMSETDGIYTREFEYQGNVDPPFGKITLSHTDMGETKRCVIVSTLLGAMRRDENDGC